jgi:hypothetical protein
VLLRDLFPAMHPPSDGVISTRRQVMPAAAAKSREPHFTREDTLNNEVIDELRLLRTKGARVISLETPSEATFCRPAAPEEDQPNEEATFIWRVSLP